MGDEEGRPAQRGRHWLDEAVLETWLREHVDGIDAPISVSRIKGGQSNPTYRVTSGDTDYVVRKKPPGKLLPTAHAIEREFMILEGLRYSKVL